METKDYNTQIIVNADISKAMEAIGRVSDWWGRDFTGQAQNLGDEFTIRFNKTFSTFKIAEKIENNKVVWTVLDSHLDWLKDQKEWNGTQVEWTLWNEENQTKIQMIHCGIVSEVECFDNCTKGWNYYIKESLYNLISSGKGMPDTPQTVRIREEL
jgi:hypothetical protein